jgi:SAM-dependent methyltransferase
MMMKKQLSAQQKVTAEWDVMAGEWDDLASGYAKAFYRMLLSKTGDLFLKAPPPDTAEASSASSSLVTVLDFGCGTGLLTEKLLQQSYIRKRIKIAAIDASSKMIEVLQEKILCRGWSSNVTAHAVVLANLNLGDDSDSETKSTSDDGMGNSSSQESSSSSSIIKDELLDSLQGSVDLIVASSVLTFIPHDDLEVTMRILGKLLRPGTGLLVHSDWPKSEAMHPDAMSEEKALQIYAMAAAAPALASGDDVGGIGLQVVSMGIEPFNMGDGGSVDVFVGVARKPAAA